MHINSLFYLPDNLMNFSGISLCYCLAEESHIWIFLVDLGYENSLDSQPSFEYSAHMLFLPLFVCIA